MFGWLYNNNGGGQPLFSITSGTKIILGLFGVAAVLFGAGYAFRPIEEVFDDLHDSRKNIKTLKK